MIRMAKTKKPKKATIKWMRFIISVALGLMAVIGISLIYDLGFDIKFTLFIALGVFILVVFFIDTLTPINLISVSDIKSIIPRKK